MDFPGKSKEEAENKILLLFLIDKLRLPISNMQLTQLMLEHRYMNYFRLQECLHNLLEQGHLAVEKHEGEDLYVISETGKRLLTMFTDLLPPGLQNRLRNAVTEIQSGLLREMSVFADAVLLSEEEYKVTLRVSDLDLPLFEAHISVGSREDAQKICKNWREKAAILYPEVLSILSK